MSKEASLKGYDKETEAISKYEHYSVGFHNTFGDISSLHVRLTPLVAIICVIWCSMSLKRHFIRIFQGAANPV